jgi:dinuclear metal center YbgI/SA1388 family protein
MAVVKDILRMLEDFAPVRLKMDFDNVGLLVGYAEDQVDRILISLDITEEVIAEAIGENAQLIVSHHPIFFTVNSVTDGDGTGRKITTLLANHISAICMHTNLDAAAGGVNDALAETAGLKQAALLTDEVFDDGGRPHSYGRFGYLDKPVRLGDYLGFLKNRLEARGLRYFDAGRDVYKVATVSGSGGKYLKNALSQGCDTLLTSDIKYDVFLEAGELGINIIDGGHFCTENVVTSVLEKKLKGAFPDICVSVSKVHIQPDKFF